jgi:hypothetical protein
MEILFVVFIVLVFIMIIIQITDILFYYNDAKYILKSTWHRFFGMMMNNNLIKNPSDNVNKIAIVSFENRKNLKFTEYHNKNIKSYCDKWGYDYLFYNECIHNVYWCKMYYVLEALKTGKYDYVAWLDSDTIIKNKNMPFDSFVNKYSSDIFVTVDGGFTTFCAGVFIIKNSPIGISFIEECIKNNLKKCADNTNKKLKGIWAGMCYEQGIMNTLIYDKYSQFTTCLPTSIVHNGNILKSNDACDINTFILHLYNSDNELREGCFKKHIPIFPKLSN